MDNIDEVIFRLMLDADLAKGMPFYITQELIDYLYENYSSSEMELIQKNYTVFPQNMSLYLKQKISVRKQVETKRAHSQTKK